MIVKTDCGTGGSFYSTNNNVTTGLGTGDGDWRVEESERETLSISLPPLGVTAGARQPHSAL